MFPKVTTRKWLYGSSDPRPLIVFGHIYIYITRKVIYNKLYSQNCAQILYTSSRNLERLARHEVQPALDFLDILLPQDKMMINYCLVGGKSDDILA